MPLYTYECPKCRKQTEMFRPICDRHLRVPCDCGAAMELQISPVLGVVKNPAVPKR